MAQQPPGRRYRGASVAIGLAVVCLLAGALVASSLMHRAPAAEGGTGHEVAAVRSAPPPTTLARPTGPPPALIATLAGATPWSRTAGGPTAGTLDAVNPFGTPEVLSVVGNRPGWLQVELPVRPNGTVGWIPAASATLTQTPYAVAVDLATHTLTVTDAGRPVMSTPVAVGAPGTPTPPARTYIWELVRPDNPDGAYGPYILGLAEFSDTYAVFNGGDAQIGIHGTDEPWSIGKSASHGCVRVPNDVITRLAALLPLGTPVTIG